MTQARIHARPRKAPPSIGSTCSCCKERPLSVAPNRKGFGDHGWCLACDGGDDA